MHEGRAEQKLGVRLVSPFGSCFLVVCIKDLLTRSLVLGGSH